MEEDLSIRWIISFRLQSTLSAQESTPLIPKGTPCVEPLENRIKPTPGPELEEMRTH